MEKLVKKHNNNLLRKTDTNQRNYNCHANNTCPLDGKYFIQLKFLLATIITETNILVTARQNSKPD